MSASRSTSTSGRPCIGVRCGTSCASRSTCRRPAARSPATSWPTRARWRSPRSTTRTASSSSVSTGIPSACGTGRSRPGSAMSTVSTPRGRPPVSWARRPTSARRTGARSRTCTRHRAGRRRSSASTSPAASRNCRTRSARGGRVRRAGSSSAGRRSRRPSSRCSRAGSPTRPRASRSSTRPGRAHAAGPTCDRSTRPGRASGTDVARHGAELLPETPASLRDPVADYLAHIELERGLSRNTVDAYARDLARYLLWLVDRGADGFDDVREEDLLAFRDDLAAAGLAASSQARIGVAVRRLHDHLLGEGRLVEDPAAALPPPRRTDSLPTALTVEQIESLLATAAGEDPVSRRSAALLELLYATGARISEAVGLDLDDLDLV